MIRLETATEVADFRTSTERDIRTVGASELWLARISLGHNQAQATEELADDLDRLFEVFQADPSQWRQSYIGATDTTWDAPAYSYAALNELPPDKRLGIFLADRADGLMDIEGEEDGCIMANWFFWLGASHILDIRAEGNHWTSKFYENPQNGQIESMDREKLYEVEQEFDVELEVHSTEVGYEINFEAVITEAPQARDFRD